MRRSTEKPESYYLPAPVAGKFLPITKSGQSVDRDCEGSKKRLAEIFDFKSSFRETLEVVHISEEPYINGKVYMRDSSNNHWYMEAEDFVHALRIYGYIPGQGISLEYRFTANYGRIYITPV